MLECVEFDIQNSQNSSSLTMFTSSEEWCWVVVKYEDEKVRCLVVFLFLSKSESSKHERCQRTKVRLIDILDVFVFQVFVEF